MKVKITKIGAAKSQLAEAITLFFEQRDPVSIHTFVGASLNILHDYISHMGIAWKEGIITHRDNIYIKDEHKKYWYKETRKVQNFLKHADKDLEQGVKEIEFNTDLNKYRIMEVITCLQHIEGENHDFLPEFRVFYGWLSLANPKLFHEPIINPSIPSPRPDDFELFREAIDVLKKPDKYSALSSLYPHLLNDLRQS